MISRKTIITGAAILAMLLAGTGTAAAMTGSPAAKAGGDDGGVVIVNTNTATCTVVSSFGPDAVTVSYGITTSTGFSPNGCTLAGLPAGAGVQLTEAYNPTLNLNVPLGTSATLILGATGGTGVVVGGGGSNTVGEFSWLAVPPS